MSIQFRPLNKVHELMNSIGYEPGYAYDDLIFSNDAVFIIQFDEKDENHLKLFINRDCTTSEKTRIDDELSINSLKKGLKTELKGQFILEEKQDSQEIDVVFFNN